ncbi:MAG: hypothetical protein DWQ07_02395 [Chloroflexi bacterium]|nr:MAG: hypothetical protein DWQ07_02395 [Chloroflexota bacterium]MBL1193651.1 hypothetical protein [Chloroflexota bacterium]NOH10943.1 hypothetical protein [Chloroflexota bacterium]
MKPIAFTIDYSSSKHFQEQAYFAGIPTAHRPLDSARWFWRILKLAWTEEVLLVDNETAPSSHPELFALAHIGLWPKQFRPAIVLTGDMYQQRKGFVGWLAKQLIHLADRSVTLHAIRTTKEMRLFPTLWNINADKLRHCPYYFKIDNGDLEEHESPEEDFIFAGGNTYRNYAPLVEAAKAFPEIKFVFATTLIKDAEELPQHIQAGPISHEEYMHNLRTAKVNIVAIRRRVTRAVGEQTFLKSMWLHKPTVVTDESGARDHIEDRKSGFIVDGSVEQYIEVIQWLFDEGNRKEVKAIGEAAHEAASPYTFDNHVANLLGIIDEAVQLHTTP